MPPHEPAASFAPDHVGRYEILLPLGTGGMATVYLARVLVVDDLYRNVALKLMHPHLRTEDGQSTAQLIGEAKLAASIRHPNVVPVLEVGEDPHGVFLVMDYVEGDTLSGIVRAALIDGATLPLRIVARILSDALLGLHAAHELTSAEGAPLSLVHRDVSPQNLLVGTDGISRLTDFGIAKVATQLDATASGVVKGKVGYMAPEQALGRRVDRRADVWAAGVIAWEMLAMRRMHGPEDQMATLLRVVSEKPPRVRDVRPDLPQTVDDAIASALTIDTGQRCPSALELRHRLLEAWKEIGPVADTAEVGEYIWGLVGPKLEARRKRVETVLADRNGASPQNAPRSGERQRARLVAAQGETSHTEATTDQSSAWSEHRRAAARRRSFLGIAAGVAAVGGLAGVAIYSGILRPIASTSRTELPSVAGTSSNDLQPFPIPTPSASVSSDAVAAAAPSNRTILLRANAPISAVRIGTRDVVLMTPTREVELQLTESERGGAVALTATAQDGRRVSVKAGADETSVQLTFAPATRAAPTRTGPAKQPEKKPPGLAPTPYGR